MTSDSNNRFTRRQILKGITLAAGATALPAIIPGPLASRAWASAAKPETTKAKLGFIALTDAAPLFVAVEKGFFAKHGMTDVAVEKQSSWGTTRDNLVLGSRRGGIDGAHILSPMPYHMASGLRGDRVPMYVVARLNVNGQAISVGSEYKDLEVGLDATSFGQALAAKRAAGNEVRAAMTFPGGTHDLWIRYWLAAAGIDPDRDLSTITVPPPQMVANMRVGSMDAFCVGAPWPGQLVKQNIGYTALTTGEFWSRHPEKCLSLRADYVDANPNATVALTKAVLEAQIYCDDPDNYEEVARICSRRRWIHAPYDDIIDRMKGLYDYGTGRVVEDHPEKMLFWNEHASYPFKSHDLWFITENQRWNILPADLDSNALIEQVNREDIWREAATALGVSASDLPESSSRGVETFFDGKVFDPENPKAYLDSLAITRTG